MLSTVLCLMTVSLLSGCSPIQKNPTPEGIDFASPNPGTGYDQSSQAVQPQNHNPNVLAGKMISY